MTQHYEYLALKEIPKLYPFTMRQLRAYLDNRDINGLDQAVRMVSNRIIIRRDLFDAWIESKGPTA